MRARQWNGRGLITAARSGFHAACLVAAALFCHACGAGRGPDAGPVPESPRARPVTAEALSALPGRQLGEFGFKLMDAAGQPVSDWRGLAVDELRSGGVVEFTLTASRAGVDELYLYVVYPSAQWSAENAELAEGVREAYLLLAVPRRIRDVLPIALARIAPAGEGELLRLRFLAGAESTFRGASLVNSDPGSAPELTVEQPWAEGMDATLHWDERNIGDYNNNGLVEIGDLSRIAQLFKHTPATTPDIDEFLLVDGDANGEVNAADLIPIGRNYQRWIEGYTLYRADGETPAAEDFTPVADPTVLRSGVFDATPEAERKHRLKYRYSFTPSLEAQHFFVRAYSADDGAPSHGPQSNTISYNDGSFETSPFWVETPGIISVQGITGGLRISFDYAVDPEGGPVFYFLTYVPEPNSIWSPLATTIPLPEEVSQGATPYSYDLLGLGSGTDFKVMVEAMDQDQSRTFNNNVATGHVPGLAAAAGEWSHWRGNPGRTGSNPAGTAREPLGELWSQPTVGLTEGPLVDQLNRVFVQDEAGVKGYDAGSGQLAAGPWNLLPDPALWPGHWPALSNTEFVGVTMDGAARASSAGVVDLPSPIARGCNGGPLLLGDYLFAQNGSGVYAQVMGSGGSSWTVNGPGILAGRATAGDGSYLYCFRSDQANGYVSRLDLLTGLGNWATLPGWGKAWLACDVSGNRLLASDEWSEDSRIEALALDSLAPAWQLPLDVSEANACPLVVARHFTAPLVLSLASSSSGTRSSLVACDPASGDPIWETEFVNDAPVSVTAGATRIFVCNRTPAGGCVYVVHPLDGSVLQQLDGEEIHGLYGEAVPAGGKLLALRDFSGSAKLQAYGGQPAQPIVWSGADGISSVNSIGTDSARVYWDSASAPLGLVVRYALYYAPLAVPGAGSPPNFVPPHVATTLVTGLTDADGLAGYLVSGLTPGQRYTFAVQAYYGRWGENAVVDGNTNWLACTAAWHSQPPLDLGAAPPPGGTQLPAGEVYLLQGLLDAAGRPHLVYNDEADTHLAHVYQDAGGAWQIESTNLAAHIAADFELSWTDGALQVAYADGVLGDQKVGVLTRTAPDTWTDTAFASLTPQNPQVAAALSGGVSPSDPGALAYTQFISGGPLAPRGEYFAVRSDGLGSWLGSAPLDDQNFCGRDLALALDPGALTPWAAFQRGYVYAPNRLTPRNGELFFARDDGAGGYAIELVDAGSNPREDGSDTNSSDVGKRVSLALDSGGLPHLAYLDLNASEAVPLGELKYARFDGLGWNVELVASIDLSIQTFASLQYTWGELQLRLAPGSPTGAGLPLIGMMARRTAQSTATGTPGIPGGLRRTARRRLAYRTAGRGAGGLPQRPGAVRAARSLRRSGISSPPRPGPGPTPGRSGSRITCASSDRG